MTARHAIARRDHIRSLRQRWEPLDEPLPLRRAHRLLDDETIERGMLDGLCDLCAPGGGTVLLEFPPADGEGNFLFLSERDLSRYLRPFVLRDLESQRLTATFIAPGGAVTGKRRKLPADRWRLIAPDWENDRAACAGELVAIDIAVALTGDGKATEPKGRPAAASAIERWWWNEFVPKYDDNPPTRVECEQAARVRFPGGFDRKLLRKLRTETPGWSKKGPRPKNGAKIGG